MGSSSEKRKRVLVTGLEGFTGSYLGPALEAAGFELHDLACDLLDTETLAERVSESRPHVVIHLAGIAFVAHGDSSEIYRVNVIGTHNLLAALVPFQKELENLIIASSANVYGNSSLSPITEEAPRAPTNDYAVSKTAVEYLALSRADTVPLTIVRPFNYTGPGQEPQFVIPKIVDHFRRRARMIELGNTDVVREYGDVRRTVEAYVRLCRSPGSGEIYNIATGQGVTLGDVISCCQEITGHSIEVRVNPQFVRKHEVKELVGDVTKLENSVGPLARFDISETLEWMLKA